MDVRLFICLLFMTGSLGQDDDEYERITWDLQLVSYDLADECSDMGTTLRRYLLGGNPNILDDKISSETDHGNFLRIQSERLMKYKEEVPYELTRNWTFLTKCGDALLPEESYNTLIKYANENLELSRTSNIDCGNGTSPCKYSKRDVEKELATSRDLDHLKTTWSKWQQTIATNSNNFSLILNLVNEAATLNDHYDAKTYWETLVDIPDAYTNAETLWNDIEPLYNSLHEFVRTRLSKHYNTNFTTIPVYLLGSNYGDDWSNVAEIVLPHPQLYHDVKVELNAADTKQLYEFADNFTRSMGLGSLGKHFWKKSIFDAPLCGAHILDYCTENVFELVTCNETSLSSYLEAHETAMRMVLNRIDYTNLPQNNLRLSPVVEAVCSMASLYGMNNLPYYDILNADVFIKENEGEVNRMTVIMMIALKVLPKLAYYYSVDKWRLQELENPSGNMVESWWEIRKKYQKVEGIDNEADFMGDEMILYNKPYLSKFLGLFLQFQFMNYHQLSFFRETSNLAKTFKDDVSFREMVQNIRTRDALDLIGYYYSFDDVSAYSLIDFFNPLADYIENAPENQSPFTVKTPKDKKPKIVLKPKPKPKSKVVAVTTTQSSTETTKSAESTTVNVTVSKLLNDQGKVVNNTKSAKHVGNYAAIAIIFGTMAAIIGICVWKRVKRKRRSNNRRPDV